MIKYALKQLWNQFLHNSWLLIELTIVFVIIWLVVAPLYVIQYQQSIPDGFEPENLYTIIVKPIDKISNEYSIKDDSDTKIVEDLNRLGNIVKADPNVAAVAIQGYDTPWGNSYNGTGFQAEGDSTVYNSQCITYLKGWDFWEVYRFSSAKDNSWESVANNDLSEEGFIITKDLNRKILKNSNGSNITRIKYNHKDGYYPVVDVINYVKSSPTEQPGSIIFMPQNIFVADQIRFSVLLIVRAKEGVKESQFIEYLKRDLAPKLKVGNLRLGNIAPFHLLERENNKTTGVTNSMRINSILTLFFLIITFLGVVASFWLRTESKKDEIGLNMALGADRSTIRLKFLLEGWILTLIASIVGFVIVLNILYFKGLGNESLNKIPEAWAVNNDYIYVAIVTAIVFILIITTVTIATIIPASIAAKTNPVDALRDE